MSGEGRAALRAGEGGGDLRGADGDARRLRGRRSDPGAPARRPRLLVVTSLYPTPDRPEVGPFVGRRVAALRARGVDVVVAASSSYRHGGLRRHLEIARIALTARGPFDGVEGHVLFPAGVIALVAARLRRRPLVVYAHGADVNQSARRTPIHRFLARLVARGAAAAVTNSPDTAEAVVDLGARPVIVSPGVDMARFAPAAEPRTAIRRRLGLPGGLVALYVGVPSERKGADVFAAAVHAATGWHGAMIGGEEVGGGRVAADIAARFPEIEQHGPVPPDDVADWIRAADVVVVPSRREPLGLAAIEALACGTPVIASATGGLATIVEDGHNGLAVPPGDVEAVARALRELTDEELRARLAANARASVRAHDIEAATDAMAEVWASAGVRL